MSNEIDSTGSLSADQLRALVADRMLEADGRSRTTHISAAQQRLWFLDQLEPNSPAYNIPGVLRLRGALEVNALQQAFNSLAARHETLRTRFKTENGAPTAVIQDEVDISIQIHDLTSSPESDRDQEATRLIHEQVKRPFNLCEDCLLRISLVRLGREDQVLIINIHHIIADEWSFKIFFRELGDFYSGYCRGLAVTLPPLPIQYGDYALWQKRWLESEECQKQVDYWKEQLSGNPTPVELPTDFPRKARQTHRGAVEVHTLGPELSKELRDLAQRERSTLFMLLLAAFKALLYRYAQQEDLIVGSPMAGRNPPETEDLIGFFVNTVPLRTRVGAEMTFRELLSEVRKVAIDAYSHQDLPFDKLVEALQPDRSVRSSPFVQVMFIFQNDLQNVELPGMTTEPIDVYTDTAKFDLTMWTADTGDHLVSGIEYNTELFESTTITRMLQHFESLLQAIVISPGDRLRDFTLLSEAERRQLIGEWQLPADPLPWSCIHEWFEAQARLTPEAIAVVFEQERLTYAELNRQANKVAHQVRRFGISPDTPVALCLERSPKMLVGILGVLKAGGAYVPIDPNCPAERLEFMMADTQAPLLLTEESLREQLTAPHAQIVFIEDLLQAEAPVSDPERVGEGENVAYIIYTSGSTGKPKGVLITHHNVVRLLKQTEQWYGFDSSDVWTLFHSYTFDFSVWEIWGALLYGGRLVVVPNLVCRSPSEFYQLLATEKVTVLNQTPSAFRQLIWAEANAPQELFLFLRYVIFGGEALELQSLKPWFDRHGDARPLLVNMYGITETTVHVTYRVIRNVDLESGMGSVIGVPIPDLRIYLLDEKLQPVPAGIPGEICVAGAGVARGYLNRPELTEQRFIADPFSRAATKLYRSGDLARYTSKGELEYLGRIDHQVKIRGYRVELGEIESALNSHPEIRESTVITSDGPAGIKSLVAYIVAASPAPTTSDLRQHLAQKVPDYMVPSAFVPLDELPLTSNGKVDKRALPAPEHNQTMTGKVFAAPQNPTETILVDIWCQLLRRKTVSIHENFFFLGGHSLLATQAVWRIAGALNIQLPVRAVFEAPTIAELAEVIHRALPPSQSGPALGPGALGSDRLCAPQDANYLGGSQPGGVSA